MDRGKMPSTGRGGKSKGPQHPQDIFALGSKSTVVVSRDSEKRNIHKPSTSSASGERKREAASFGAPPPGKRSRIGSPAESVTGTSLEVDPVDLVPHVLQALDTHNSDKLLGLLTGSIRLLKSQRSKPDPILCMSMLYLTKIRPNMFAHDTVTQSLCSLLKREQGAGFKSKGNPLVFVLACNMLYAGHKDNKNWPDTFIKVYIEDALNERWWVDCSWCKCLVENIVTAFNTKQPPAHLIPNDNALGTMSPSGSGSPLVGTTEEDIDISDIEYTVFPRYSTNYESVECLVLEAIKEQIQRRAAPDAIGKGFLKLLSATCGFPEIRMISASRLEAWLHSGKLWRSAQELLACVCCNAAATGPAAARDHEVLAQLARMRLKTKPLVQAYVSCLREMVSESPALLRSVVTHTIYNELSNVRSPNNMAVLAALVQAQPQLVPVAMADTYLELLLRPEEYLRPLRALTREVVRAARDVAALVPLAHGLAAAPPHDPPQEIRERAFLSVMEVLCVCCLCAATARAQPDHRAVLGAVQAAAARWLLEVAGPVYRPSRHDFQLALNKIMFVEPAESYSKVDNWPPESERTILYKICCEAPLPQNTLLRVIFIGLAKEIPVTAAEVFELVEQLVRRACALPAEDGPLQVDKLELADYIFEMCQFHPPDNITLPAGYTPPPLAITSLYWRGWLLLVMVAAHNPPWAEKAARLYPTLRALIDCCITNSFGSNKPCVEWYTPTPAEVESERAAVLQLETHLAAASCSKVPVTEHNCRLLSQLTRLDPTGPARKPPPGVLEALSTASSSLRLGRLACRSGPLLLELVERVGTARALPWLQALLRQSGLRLSALPVQCLAEFLAAGGDAAKAPELAAHLRAVAAASPQGARALLACYLPRLASDHAPARRQAGRGLKLVLTQNPEDTSEMDYNADVSPDEWLSRLPELPHWESVRTEAVVRVRAACLVECAPTHLAAYVGFLAMHVAHGDASTHDDLVMDLSQVLMERMSVMSHVLPAPDAPAAPTPHRALNAITTIFYNHLQAIRQRESSPPPPPTEERVSLSWAGGWRADLPLLVAHAHLKLLCYGPSMYDTNQDMYSWLVSVWTGASSPVWGGDEGLLPDWLRLHLVRSARAPLLAAGLRGLPAHKLALFVQTFGVPVYSMSALLCALDACPAGAVLRLGVERPYMAQLLRVQRARGAAGGDAFAAALGLVPPQYPPEDTLFSESPLPVEEEGAWGRAVGPPSPSASAAGPLVVGGLTQQGPAITDDDFTFICAKIVSESNLATGSGRPYTVSVVGALEQSSAALSGALVLRPARAGVLLRALTTHTGSNMAGALYQISEKLLKHYKCTVNPIVGLLREMAARAADGIGVKRHRPEREDVVDVPSCATKDQLVALLESATPNNLEEIGNRIISTQDTNLVVDVISHILEKNQAGDYDFKVKTEEGADMSPVFSSWGRGCGLLLDWMAELSQETLGEDPEKQMRLVFTSCGAPWRSQVRTLLAHRASWRTLHRCLRILLKGDGSWSASSVLEFAQTLTRSPRVWQGRDKTTPKHHSPEDLLRLTHHQLCVLVRYILEESRCLPPGASRLESRLELLLQCCGDEAALLCAAPTPEQAKQDPVAAMLLTLLYMKVPKIMKVLSECGGRPRPPPAALGAPADVTSATDLLAHCLLCALAATPQGKEHHHKAARLECGIRSLLSRGGAAGARALPLLGALLRGAAPRDPHLPLLLNALDILPADLLLMPQYRKELSDILECYVSACVPGGRETPAQRSLQHRLGALLRRCAALDAPATQVALAPHAAVISCIPALSGALSLAGEAPPASAQPPPQALAALQAREHPEDLHYPLQELESWGGRRGGAWGGAAVSRRLLRAAAPLLPSPYAPVRHAALSLLVKLLPAVRDTEPALLAILECLECEDSGPAVAVLDRLPELLPGMMEHAAKVLATVFALAVKSRLPADNALTACVTTINMLRGC